jgi:NAD(P)-dependent dehydrogenase (short-subunit alcohol dehydrogenase family)
LILVHKAANCPCSEAFGMRCDVTSWDEQVRFFDEAYKRWDAIDVVVSEHALRNWASD